jgi:hypothetical protein
VDPKNSEAILDKLYAISGKIDRALSDAEYRFVKDALIHQDESVRERAIFIGGLRSLDPIFLGYLLSVLLLRSESSQENKRLIIESLVSATLLSSYHVERMIWVMQLVLKDACPSSLEAKAAYVGIKRLRGEISKTEFATLDYDQVNLENENF